MRLANPKALAQNMGLTMFYIPPHVTFEPSSHHTEECYDRVYKAVNINLICAKI